MSDGLIDRSMLMAKGRRKPEPGDARGRFPFRETLSSSDVRGAIAAVSRLA
jgi:hypothetical protein